MNRVHHRERAMGVDLRLIDFLDWWDVRGPFAIVVDPKGGIRTSVIQQELWAVGRTIPGKHAGEKGYPPLGECVTWAKDAADGPHCHAGALDCWPAVLRGSIVVAIFNDKDNPAHRIMFEKYGREAEEAGLVWGGRWKRYDAAHVEVPDWRSLPLVHSEPFGSV
jgi:hypothetical protein